MYRSWNKNSNIFLQLLQITVVKSQWFFELHINVHFFMNNEDL